MPPPTPHERFRELQRQYEELKRQFRNCTNDPDKEDVLSKMGVVLGQLFGVMAEIRNERDRNRAN